MTRRIALVCALTLLIGTFPQNSGACTNYNYSPNNFGFCRDGWIYGYSVLSCKETVVDTFNGRTDCTFSGTFGECDWRPNDGGPGGGGGGDCWWTDWDGSCIYDLDF